MAGFIIIYNRIDAVSGAVVLSTAMANRTQKRRNGGSTWQGKRTVPPVPSGIECVTPEEIKCLAALFNGCRYTDAENMVGELVSRFPTPGAGWQFLLNAFKSRGHLLQTLVTVRNKAVQACFFQGNSLYYSRHLEEAAVCYRNALELEPAGASLHNNLGNTLKELGRLAEAESSYRYALDLNPDYAEAHNNLGNLFKDSGLFEQAVACYRTALRLKPDFYEAYSNLLLVMNSVATAQTPELLGEARAFGALLQTNSRNAYTAWSCQDCPKRLRVGVVSGDLRNHPVGHFLESMLAKLDCERIELVAYSNSDARDTLTEHISPYFVEWRSLVGVSDADAAAMIHADGIHLLLDLAGHTAHNRLPLFARKPAPVQASWLGYFATTGVAEMDYLLGDPLVMPAEESGHFTETVWRLPESYLCFTRPDSDLAVGVSPALSAGYITFGCFNNLSKMNDAVVAVWARVLHAVPDSRLFLKTIQLGDEAICEITRDRFAAFGIGRERLVLEGGAPREQLLASYSRVDIALDPFPYPGGTTSVESLWMGVPVITCRGNRFLSHIGESLMHNAGLSDWVGIDEDDYVARAVQHASDVSVLSAVRSVLRSQVVASPLFDAASFAQNFTDALWGMWQGYVFRAASENS